MPLAPKRAARGRARLALTVLALLATAGWSAYLYEPSRLLQLGDIVVSALRSPSHTDMAMTAAATAPREARPYDPALAVDETAVSPDADREADIGGNASDATASELTPPTAAPPQSVGTSASLAAAAVPNVSGEWRLVTQVETPSYSPFAGLKLDYEMKLEQDGDRVTGVGKKVRENEKGIGPGAQTAVTVSGTIAGDRLTLNFVERGTQRATQGKFVLLVDEAGTLWGRFSTSAARSSGHVEAHRVSAQ